MVPDYGFLVVSVFILAVSFLVVSTTVVLVESTTLVVSVVLVELVPLQAANDKAIKAIKLNLMVFFMFFDD
jgi:hypothetical protein